MSKPTIDLTSQAILSPQDQLSKILDQVTPDQKKIILSMVSGKHPSWGDLIREYGSPSDEEQKLMPTNSDIDTIYRSVFKANNLDAIANPFLRIEELYDALAQELPGSYDITNDKKDSGLFTNIDESTMAAIYEVIYGKPMNFSDYETYLSHGTPAYYKPAEEESLTNDNDQNDQNPGFNQNKYSPALVNKIVVNNNFTDTNFRDQYGIEGDNSNDLLVSPYKSGHAVELAYNMILSVLKLPVEKQVHIPIEAAIYFTTLNINNQRFVLLPKYSKGAVTYKRYHKLFKLSQCASVILKDIINHSIITYNGIPNNSMITYLCQSRLNNFHAGIFNLCKKTLLELYSICYAIKYPDTYLDYLTTRDIQLIKKDIHFIKVWSSHFSKYRPMIEIWDNLETAIGYIYPYFKGILDSTDLHYSNRQFNDNSL